MQSYLGPLPIYLLHFRQHLLSPLIARHEPEMGNIEANFSDNFLQLLLELRWLDEGALLRGRIHPGDLKPVQLFRWISKRNIERTDCKPRLGKQSKNRF